MKKTIVSMIMVFGLFGFSQAAVLDDAVSWMSTNGLTIFKTTTEYQPNNYIRRDEAAKLFVKFAKIIQKDVYKKTIEECQFSDLNDAHIDLKDIVVESCRMGIFQGANGKFMPRGSLTNEQAIAVLVRIYDGYKSETNVSYRSENYYKAAETYDIFSKVPMMNERKNTTTRGNVGISIYTVQDLPGNYNEGYDFNSEFNMCTTTSCYENLVKKYAVKKETACTYKDDIVTTYPLETSRPKEKTITKSFYKYDNKLFYQIAVSTNGEMKGGNVKGYLYMYDCKTKKSFDMSKDIPTAFLNIGSPFDADDETLKFAEIVQFNKGKIFFEREPGGLAGKRYFFFDTVKSLFNEIEVEKFTNYNKRFNIVDKVAPNFQSDLNFKIIDTVNKEFIGSLYYLFPGSDLKGKIGLSKINLLTQTIEL